MNDDHRLPSPSGARLAGDDFQHIVTWIELLRLIESDSVTQVGFEVGQTQAGVVDDLVVRRGGDRPDRYAQIKFAVDDTTPLSEQWFTTPPRSGSESPLQRFHHAHRDLSAAMGRVELELITNRQIATGDPILSHRQNISGTLAPRLFAATAAETVAARAKWAAHLDLSEDRLAELLADLVISPARGTIDDLLRAGRGAMGLAGLRGDEEAMVIAVGLVRRLIEQGVRELDRSEMEALVAEGSLQGAAAYSTLVVQEIDESPLAALAPASVDWVELFIGDTPESRRATVDPASWEATMRPDLRRAIGELREVHAHETIRVDGAFRLASSFILGFELNERTGVELVMPYAGGDWRSSAEREAAPVDIGYREIAQGSDLAVAVGISAPLGDDVEHYLRDSELPVATLLEISPEGGASRQSVSGPGQARSIVERVVDICREATPAEVTALHLFLAGPRPLVTMLGRVWNRLPPTYVYADLNPGYGPTYFAES